MAKDEPFHAVPSKACLRGYHRRYAYQSLTLTQAREMSLADEQTQGDSKVRKVAAACGRLELIKTRLITVNEQV